MSFLKVWRPGQTLHEVKIQAISEALYYYKGNKTMTAKGLGISIRSLRDYLKAYDKEIEYIIDSVFPKTSP
jgi:transcriptional regulator with PAS, ATPase and Fis domain